MELTVKLLDIANRGVLLHSTDAQNIRVRDGDRIQIVDKATGKTARARVDTTRSLIEPGGHRHLPAADQRARSQRGNAR